MLDKRQQQILAVRNQVIKNRKVLCTGNPNKKGTIASGVKEIWPETTFIHLSNGFDLKDISSIEDKLKKLFQTHNTFINASYLSGMQIKLLELCHQHMTIGEVYNIGSTNEYDGLSQDEAYGNNKRQLREISLKLNSFRFQTTHIVMGGIDTGNSQTENWIKPIKIAEMIKWITEQDVKIPIIGIDQPKEPW
tara:strand:- start:96 stop:671 length:576 start_codon:yes stop_codon:yes gene_type:complete